MRLIETIAPLYFIFILIELAYTYIKKKDYFHFEDSIVDLSLGVLSRIFDGFILIGLVFTYQVLSDSYSFKNIVPNFVVSSHSVFHWLILFILLDFLFYLAHRYSHEIKILWASHVVHHSSEEFNLTVALRQSFVRNIGIGIFYLPLACLGFPVESYLVVDALNRTYQFWVHTRTIGKLHPVFEFIFVTPSHHRVHHAMNPEYIDKNYGGVFIFWDRLFSTFQEESVEPKYGLVKQLRSSNPICANLHVFKDLFWDLKKTNRKWEGFKAFFSYPSFRPKDLVFEFGVNLGASSNFDLNRNPTLKDKETFYRPVSGNLKVRIYLFFQWLVSTLLSLVFIKRIPSLNLLEIVSFTFLFIYSFYSLGVWIENKKEVLKYEIPKFLFWLVIIIYFFF